MSKLTLVLRTNSVPSIQPTMSITEFIAQAHPATLDWIEESLMEKLLEVDKWQRATEMAKELREVTSCL